MYQFEDIYQYPFHPRHIHLFLATRNCKGEGGIQRRLKSYILHPDFEVSVTGFEVRVTGSEVRVTGFEVRVTGFEVRVTGSEVREAGSEVLSLIHI